MAAPFYFFFQFQLQFKKIVTQIKTATSNLRKNTTNVDYLNVFTKKKSIRQFEDY